MAIDKKTGKTYESSLKATAKWKKEHTKQIKFNFNLVSDADVIQAILTAEPNKTEYVRKLVREDIRRNS